MPIDPKRFDVFRKEFGETRTIERVEAHLELELALARRLKASSREQRASGLYTEVYGELFYRLRDHPQHSKAAKTRREDVARQVALIMSVWPQRARFLEIGAGDAAVSLALAAGAESVIAVDVSDAITDKAVVDAGKIRFSLTDGLRFDLADGEVNFAYSNQLIEHLHPDDALEQTREVRRCLGKNGAYYVVTPHRLTGPHDVSIYIGDTPQGLHLKEYRYADLRKLGQGAGFNSMSILLCRGSRRLLTIPAVLGVYIETVFSIAAKAGFNCRSSRIARFLLGAHVLFRV